MTVRATTFVVAAVALTALLPAAHAQAPRPPPTAPVIVVLADQHEGLRSAPARRSRAMAGDRSSLTAEVARSGGTLGVRYRLFNAFAARVGQAERARLEADPAVAEVVDDVVLRRAAPAAVVPRTAGRVAGSFWGPRPLDPANAAADAASGLCSRDPAHPGLEPEALELIHAASRDPSVRTAQSLVTGAGVTVGFLADAVDVDHPDLLRQPGGERVVSARWMGSRGPQTDAGIEAMLDAGSIAAQGNVVYDLGDSEGLPGCKVRILGVAPGAAVAAADVFNDYVNQLSVVVQGIQSLVLDAHVDVLNESFGFHNAPDTAVNLIRQADLEAVAQGVTVVVASADWGPGNTIGSPGSQPGLITVGASTQLRDYVQSGIGGAALADGWRSDGISGMSSSGFTQEATTLDLVAPGDHGWSLCCAAGQSPAAPPLGNLAGTSESAPLVAGVAALVIEAYRKTHGGASPAPGLVKQLILGTAEDLGVPGERQGAGRVDAMAAVDAARSMGAPDAGGGPVLLTAPTQLSVQGLPGATATRTVTVTNAGTGTQTIQAHVRSMKTVLSRQTGSVRISDRLPTVHWNDNPNLPWYYPDLSTTIFYDDTTTVIVPPGADQLRVAASSGFSGGIPHVTLLDPQGAIAGYSFPLGYIGVGQVTVAAPAAGAWTVVLGTDAFTNFRERDLHYTATISRFETVDEVSPSSMKLGPGKSRDVTVRTSLPAQSGDSGRDLVLDGGSGRRTVLPMVVRSEVVLGPDGGTFAGVLTAGNGRVDGAAEIQTFAFQVPPGRTALDVRVTAGEDYVSGESVADSGYLIDPDGNALAYGTGGRDLRVHRSSPRAGPWRFVMQRLPSGVSAEETHFSGAVTTTAPPISADGLPVASDGALIAGRAVTGTVHVTNDGGDRQKIFLDARLDSVSDQRLLAQAPGNETDVALPFQGVMPPRYSVPPATDALTGFMSASEPITFDMAPMLHFGGFLSGTGDPSVGAIRTQNTATARIAMPELVSGPWYLTPAGIGPFAAPMPPGHFDASLTAHTRDFDRAVTSPTGDVWLAAIDPTPPVVAPVQLAPGASVDVPVTITPSGAKGDIVTGELLVSDLRREHLQTYDPATDDVVAFDNDTATVLQVIPYRYKIADDTPPDLTMAVSHEGPFRRGGADRYRLVAGNPGAEATDGSTVTVQDTLPAGLHATGMHGDGWTCTPAPARCTSRAVVAPGAHFPPIELKVSVDSDATSLVTNAAWAHGGGQVDTTNDRTEDPTAIADALPAPAPNPVAGPGAPDPPGPAAGPAAPDPPTGPRGAPRLTNFRQSEAVWGRVPAPRSTTFSFDLDSPARVRLDLIHYGPGRMAGGRCVARGRAYVGFRACVLRARAGTLEAALSSGHHRLRFTGVLPDGRRAPYGRYRVVARARAFGMDSHARSLTFRILGPR